jgi:glycosyltransferase involved in cell wall biosynthesis
VHLLADGLVDSGVDVTLFASGDSTTRAKLISSFETAPSEHLGETLWELEHLLPVLKRVDEFDVVHDHSGPLGLTTLGLMGYPLLHTVHGALTGRLSRLYEDVCSSVERAGLVSLTLSQRKPAPALPWVANIYNAVDVSRYSRARQPTEALLFLGRMSPDKGAHHAIQIARQTGRPLQIAAKCREPAEIAYFEEFVAPHLDDQIAYLGEVGFQTKCDLLSKAHALLLPIEWEEPFGLVIIEALAAGTPIVAMRNGSVPELLRQGETGLIADDLPGMVNALAQVDGLDTDRLRQEAAQRFSIQRFIESHLDTYEIMTRAARAQVAVTPVPLPTHAGGYVPGRRLRSGTRARTAFELSGAVSLGEGT